MLTDPRDTVDFDREHQDRIDERVRRIGSDGRLSVLADGTIAHVGLLEKLLLAALVKIGNLVPGGGIWMNTQRPEWNDANNALVGYGLSMVTLCYLRRYLVLLADLVEEHGAASYGLSEEVLELFEGIDAIVRDPAAGTAVGDDGERKRFMDRMGAVSGDYRDRVYSGLGGSKGRLASHRFREFVANVLSLLDESIAANRRDDGLYHAYNLLDPDSDGHAVEYLQEMLEGQVAVLSSGALEPEESLALLDSLKRSRMFREDQGGYTLYPATRLPGFLDKNIISPERVAASPWIRAEIERGNGDFVEADVLGQVHFNGRFRNAAGLRAALESERGLSGEVADEVCGIFEDVFEHRRFTGRSGAMYKYEGLGCIYWHMVSKLLLAVGETVSGLPDSETRLREGLLSHYDSIKAGLGAHKPPAEYGAFPMDPYSHTPAFTGVQQPGMTGQVKEDLISRFAELGVGIHGGCVQFRPGYLRTDEFFGSARPWNIPPRDDDRAVDLPKHSLAFLFCGVPVVYRQGDRPRLRLFRAGAEPLEFNEPALDRDWSRSLFSRDGRIVRIEVEIDPRCLR